jgi:hypothetical protein
MGDKGTTGRPDGSMSNTYSIEKKIKYIYNLHRERTYPILVKCQVKTKVNANYRVLNWS